MADSGSEPLLDEPQVSVELLFELSQLAKTKVISDEIYAITWVLLLDSPVDDAGSI